MTTSTDQNILILGAGQAAGTAVASLRQFGHKGPITLIGDEPAPPYQRPPLSKAYFKGELPEERLFVKPLSFYETQNVTLRLGTSAKTLERANKTVTMEDGTSLSYDKLIIATGSRPRTLPVKGADLDGVLTLRSLADVEKLQVYATPGRRIVVIGAGYIGLEAAAVARQMGLEVTVLEASERVLARVTSPTISEFYQTVHRQNGVDIRVSARMEGLEGDGSHVTGVKMADGDIIPADVVLVGIGILPNQDLAEAAGLLCENGINTDAEARTNDPDIYAIGDCANREIVQYGYRGRLESVHNAIEMGKIAAASICGKPAPKLDAPWFWSDQYDLKLQTAGLLTGFDQAVVRGDMEAHKFSVWYLKGGRFLAVDAINVPGDFMAAKRLVGSGAILDPQELADVMSDLKSLVLTAVS
ncbi:NAD(P)/FAD-dependent oxidoreductase [Celeribacter neptunius]|nr:FAD-dependent oxidoreductase [Celeribacter neptunius]